MGLFESCDSIKGNSKRNQLIKNYCDDNYSGFHIRDARSPSLNFIFFIYITFWWVKNSQGTSNVIDAFTERSRMVVVFQQKNFRFRHVVHDGAVGVHDGIGRGCSIECTSCNSVCVDNCCFEIENYYYCCW